MEALIGAWFQVLAVYESARAQTRGQAPTSASGSRWQNDLRDASDQLAGAANRMQDQTLVDLLSGHLGRLGTLLDNDGPAFSILPRIALSVSQALARHPQGECALGRMRAYDSWDHAVLAAYWRAEAGESTLEEWNRDLREATRTSQDADARSTLAAVTAMQVSMACSLLDVTCVGLEEANEELAQATAASAVSRATRNLVRATQRAIPLLSEHVPSAEEHAAWQEAASLAEEAGGAWRSDSDHGLRAAEQFQSRIELVSRRLAVAIDSSMAAGKACGREHSIEPPEGLEAPQGAGGE